MRSENLGFGWMVVNAEPSRMRDRGDAEGINNQDTKTPRGKERIGHKRTQGTNNQNPKTRRQKSRYFYNGKRRERRLNRQPLACFGLMNTIAAGLNGDGRFGSRWEYAPDRQGKAGWMRSGNEDKRVKVVKTRQQTSHRRVEWSACIGYCRLRRRKWLISRIFAGKTRA